MLFLKFFEKKIGKNLTEEKLLCCTIIFHKSDFPISYNGLQQKHNIKTYKRDYVTFDNTIGEYGRISADFIPQVKALIYIIQQPTDFYIVFSYRLKT